jgi:predicted dehydrogenase
VPEPLQLALVGAGTIAGAYRQALQRAPELQLAAAVDPDPRARGALPPGLPAFASVDALLAARKHLDAALVLAPPLHHEALTIALLRAGVHVLCEKPLAPTVAAAQRMLAAAREAGRRLMLGSKFRYTPDVVAARALLDQRCCGDVVLYENVFCSHVDMTRRWNSDPATSGGGVLIDNGCHSVDLARHLLGPLARVHAVFGRRVQRVAVEDTARVSFTSVSGAIGGIDLSWSVHKETDAYVRIHGDAGTLEIGWKGSRWKRANGAWQPFGGGYDKIDAFAGQLRNFAAVVRGTDAPVTGDADALASVVVIDCAYRSAAEDRWIDVPGDADADARATARRGATP